ncbi:MAG: VanZ family protein [Lachnospiraceae bacterium]|nr:VanZ family protein [Lachnospiraceae bacterium]
MTKSRRYLILTIAIMVFIFVQSALPSDLSGAESGWITGFLVRIFGLPEEGLHLVVRKLAHFTEYLILGVSLCLTVRYGAWKGNAGRESAGAGSERRGAGGRFRLREVIGAPGTLTFAGRILAWGIGAFYAVTDEFHQFFVAGRSCDFRDMCIDAAGVLCGCALYSIFH